jgi:surfeit locus 1 family protein
MASFNFRPSVLPTLGAVALIGLTLALGNWQLNRAEQKRELQARLDSLQREPAVTIPKGAINASDFEFRTVEVVGEFEPRCTVYLDNKLRGHVPGYEIVTPVSVGASGKYVAVNRGWLAGTGDRSRLPPVATPSGQVKVSGAAVIPSARIVELSNETVEDRLWQNLVLERYREWCRLDLAPFVIQQTNDFGDGLRREWPRPDLGIDMHRGYALQWFSLALLVAVLYVALNVRRGPRRPG